MQDFLYQLLIEVRLGLKLRSYRTYWKFLKRLRIMSSAETVDYIIKNKCSASRFGDGEFAVMIGASNGFQKKDPILAKRLKEVILTNNENVLICIPKGMNDRSDLRIKSRNFLLGILLGVKDKITPFLSHTYCYGDSYFSRFYMIKKHKENISDYVYLLKKIWEGRKVLMVEGETTCLGVGNDLFENATRIRRILCPSLNAFSKYEAILSAVKTNVEADELVIASLGMTATVLAYDLGVQGIQTIDLGHVDIEYEWMKMGVTEKVAIPTKFVNEVSSGNSVSPNRDPKYLSQVLLKITN